MVTRPRLRSFFTAVALYAIASALIGYFGVNAYSGNFGLNARQDIDARFAELTQERDRLRAERERWQHRVGLLRPAAVDADLLDERARELLNFADPRDSVMLLRSP